MRLAVEQGHPQVDHRVPEPAALLHLRPDALLDARDELTRDRATDHLVHELEPRALRQRLDLDRAHGVLTVAAGLLDVPAQPPGAGAEGLAQRHDEGHLVHVHPVALGQPLDGHLGVRLAQAPEHELVGLEVVLDPQRGVLGREPRERLGQPVLVLLGARHDRHRQQGLGQRPRPEHPRLVDAGEGVAGLGPAQPADRADVARDHPVGRAQLPAEDVRQRAGLLVLVVVLVARAGAEERREVPGHVHRLVVLQRAGEDADQAEPPDVGVARGLDDLGDQRAGGVAGDRVGSGARGQVDVRRGVLGGGREAAHDQVEQLGAPDAGRRAGRDDGVEAGQRHRTLEVLDEHLLVDLLATDVALHERLVLGLLDHRLDQLAAQAGLLGGVAGREEAGQPGDVGAGADRHVERHDLLPERVLGLAQHPLEVGPGLVQLGDDHDARHRHRGALAPQRPGRVVDALVGRHDEERTVGRAQAGAELTDEVGVPGGVDEVDLDAVVDQRRDREGDRAAVGVLGLLEVGDGRAVAHGARAGECARGGEQGLGEGGLAGARGPDQHHVADPVRAARRQILAR